MSGKPTIFYGALLLSGVNLLLQGVSMLFGIYLSSAIGAAGLGLLQLVLSVGGMALTLGVAGLRITAMYLCAQELTNGKNLRRVLSLCLQWGLALSLAVGFALMLGAEALAVHWIGDARGAGALRILGLFLPVTCLTSIFTGYFTAAGRVRELVGIEVGERGVFMLLTVALLKLWAGQDLSRACCAIVLGSSLASVGSLAAMGLIARLPKGGTGRFFGKIIKTALPLALGDTMRSGLSTAEHMLIPRGLERHGDADAMGAYGTIHGMVFPVIVFPMAFLGALIDLLIPELSKSRIKGRTERIRALTDHCFRVGAIFACLCAGVLHLYGDILGELLYHSASAGEYLALFAPLVIMLYLDSLTDGILKGLGQQVHSVRYNTITSGLDVLLLIFLLPSLGITGYFISFTLTHFINFLLSMGRLIKVTGYRLPAGFCLRSILLFCLCLMAGKWLFAPLFLGLLLLTKTVTQEDLQWLRGVLKRKRCK